MTLIDLGLIDYVETVRTVVPKAKRLKDAQWRKALAAAKQAAGSAKKAISSEG